jgi:DNA repair exonuclease SbcCD nuclease subunit
MKIGLISDLHLLSKTPENRIDNILEKQWVKLSFVLDYCQDNNIQYLLQAGDFFDKPRDWETLYKTIEILSRYNDVSVFCVQGQHDKYMRSDDTVTNLSLLSKLGLITILNPECFIYPNIKFWGLDFQDGMNINKSIADMVNSNTLSKTDYNILVIHAPITYAPLYPGHEFSQAQAVSRANKDFKVILCGDIHREFLIEAKNRIIANTGPMIRKEHNDYNQSHIPNFLIVDTNNSHIDRIVIPHNPSKDIFKTIVSTNETILSEFVSAIQNPVQNDVNIFTSIERFIKDNDIDPEVTKIIMGVVNES